MTAALVLTAFAAAASAVPAPAPPAPDRAASAAPAPAAPDRSVSAAAAPGFDPEALAPYARRGVQGEYLRALGLIDKGRHEQAARALDALAARYPPLAEYCAYKAALAWYRARRFALAAARARAVPDDSVLRQEAELLAADALHALGRGEEARRAWRAYLERHPGGMRLAEVHYRLGDHARAWALGAGTAWEERAREHVDPERVPAPLRVLRGLRLHDLHRNRDAERELAAALRAGGLAPGEQCTARYHLADAVFDQRDRTRAEPLFAEAAEACDRAGDADLRVKARYNVGRCRMNLGRHAAAAEAFQLVQREPHSYADDGRLREAEAWAEAGDHARAADLLASLPGLFPDGDMKGEALWRLARQAIFEGRDEDALRWLERNVGEVPRETDFWAEGRALYWRGAVLARLGRSERARESLERCAREYPLGYYALLAHHRLRALAPEQAARLEADLLAPIPASPAPLRLPPSAAFAQAHFSRAVELVRLGQAADARRELAAAGARPGEDGEDLLWAASALHARAGRWDDSHWIPRRSLPGFKLLPPHGTHAARWRLAYPRGYPDLIDHGARAEDVPAALLFSIVREESAFSPEIESWANAIGLTQLILPTAKRFSAGARVTPARLRDPAFNVPIGARFLGFLWKRFGRRPQLAVAAYNAGEGAVDRWLREGLADGGLDLFVERIPYDQTRRYTKRVLSSYFAYHALYPAGSADPLPPLPARRAGEDGARAADSR